MRFGTFLERMAVGDDSLYMTTQEVRLFSAPPEPPCRALQWPLSQIWHFPLLPLAFKGYVCLMPLSWRMQGRNCGALCEGRSGVLMLSGSRRVQKVGKDRAGHVMWRHQRKPSFLIGLIAGQDEARWTPSAARGAGVAAGVRLSGAAGAAWEPGTPPAEHVDGMRAHRWMTHPCITAPLCCKP
jgi:hypothetical protein